MAWPLKARLTIKNIGEFLTGIRVELNLRHSRNPMGLGWPVRVGIMECGRILFSGVCLLLTLHLFSSLLDHQMF